jgi:hypothetical protein
VTRALVIGCVVVAACKGPAKVERIPVERIKIVSQAELRTTTVGGRMTANEIELWKSQLPEGQAFFTGDDEAINASYVLVDAENQSEKDAFVTLDGTLIGDNKQTAGLKAESLYVPAGDSRTFLLLDDKLAPEPWAQGVKVVVTGAMVAKFPPAMDIQKVNVFTDGDHVVAAAEVTATAKRDGEGIVHCAFHDAAGDPIARAHAVLVLQPGQTSVVRFKGPTGSKTATIFAGDEVY